VSERKGREEKEEMEGDNDSKLAKTTKTISSRFAFVPLHL